MEKPKGYFIKKRINRPAKIVGLYYNTFFIFILSAAVIFMLASLQGFMGLVLGVFFIIAIYFVLFYVQTKLGPKELKKMINDYNRPINHIKITKSIKRQ
ncbi:hypothetical protein [Maribacter sp.]|uniref:hypothetical protein n=1 Tax=Maribacter sp. TaxID=1897614 RepID=UPI0025C5F20D|nr:hypothetical protein [Maribacter sp.]|tara:strand:- start:4116 stop:4412 length:297 start_codon:yes stop_codon:yes gene_type:complete